MPARLIADIPECAVALVQEKLAGLAEADSDLCLIHLWVYMAVDRDEIEPSVVIDVVEGISPADDVDRGAGDSEMLETSVKFSLPSLRKNSQVLLAEVSDGDGETPGVQIISKRHAHICQGLAVLIQSHTRLDNRLR